LHRNYGGDGPPPPSQKKYATQPKKAKICNIICIAQYSAKTIECFVGLHAGFENLGTESFKILFIIYHIYAQNPNRGRIDAAHATSLTNRFRLMSMNSN